MSESRVKSVAVPVKKLTVTDCYQLLGMSPSTPTAEIRRVYVKAVRDSHPDCFMDAAQKAEAHEIFIQGHTLRSALRVLIAARENEGVSHA
jgi:DnaJ-class molecular chaperone